MTNYRPVFRFCGIIAIVCLGVLFPDLTSSAAAQSLYTLPTTINGITYAGKGTCCSPEYPTAVALDSSNNLYYTDPQSGIWKVSGGDATLYDNPAMNWLSGVAVDQWNDVYFVDEGAGVYEEPDTSTPLNSCVGNTCADYSLSDGPTAAYGVAVDSDGNTWVTGGSPLGSGLWENTWDGTGWHLITTQINGENIGISVDRYNNILVADSSSCIVQVYYQGSGTLPNLPSNASAGNVYTIAGAGCGYSSSGSATSAQLPDPGGVAVDSSGNVYISGTYYVTCSGTCTSGGNVVQKVSVSTGQISTIAGTSGPLNNPPFTTYSGVPATSGVFTPWGLAFDSSGNLYIAAQNNYAILELEF